MVLRNQRQGVVGATRVALLFALLFFLGLVAPPTAPAAKPGDLIKSRIKELTATLQSISQASPGGGQTSQGGGTTAKTAAIPVTVSEVPNAILQDGFVREKTYGKSYLAKLEHPGAAYRNEKRILYLEADPANTSQSDGYQRGYAHGFLCAESVYNMTHAFLDKILFDEFGGLPLSGSQFPVIWPTALKLLEQAVLAQQYTIPQEYLDEMRGVADGATAVLSKDGRDVKYEDVLMINAGFDFLLGTTIYQGGSLACNAFSVFGAGTTDGRLFHGRDFMFATGGDIFSNEALIIIQKPKDGIPFAAFAAPVFVGSPTVLNMKGISCNMDMVPSRQNRALASGMGTMLICRHVAERAASLYEGIDIIRNTPRGTSWLYMLADANIPDAAVLETVADKQIAGGSDLLTILGGTIPGLESILVGIDDLYPGELLAGTASIVDGAGDLVEWPLDFAGLHPEKGVAMRSSTYKDPAGFENYYIAFPAPDPLLAFTKGKGDGKTDLYAFPLQKEDKDGLVAVTNHYILPNMNLSQAGILYHTADTFAGGGRESEWRYNTMVDLILGKYGAIDAHTAMYLIDFLNPREQTAASSFYGTDQTQSVKGHHVVMDGRTFDVWSLHGYYDEPWMYLNLKDIIEHPITTPANQPPVAEAGADKTALTGQSVAFDGSASQDPDGTITSYRWDFGDGTGVDGDQASHNYGAAGSFTAALTVTDDKGATASDTCVVTVTAPPALTTISQKDVLIPMADGTLLAADIYRPDTQDRYPAILTMTPYRKDVMAPALAYNTNFAPQGYAVVYVDVRGTGNSTGDWASFGDIEGQDGAAVVEWIASQPWCDGNVGMLGPSYMGIIQLFTAGKQPPHLKAIFPIVAMSNAYKDIVWQGGNLDAEFIPAWLGLVVAMGLVPPEYTVNDPATAILAISQHITHVPEIGMWILNNCEYGETGDNFYWERAPQRVWDKINVPMYATAGWF
ncbi:MAG: CocE/NonD family hydrolase, partial [Smithellaceae bacterium]|nr:CocE/NonD family hydrolase [Smithellaceae bacterium]